MPELLIGFDNAYFRTPRRIAYDGRFWYAVVLTKLGWVIYDSGRRPAKQPSYRTLFILAKEMDEASNLEKLLNNYIVNRYMGVNVARNDVESVGVVRARTLLEKNTKWEGERFET